MRSSYSENNYDSLFEAIAKIYNPELIVECGVLDGYSLLALARGAPDARVVGIDLFDDYEYKHGSKSTIYIRANELNIKNIELIQKDAFLAAEEFDDNSIDVFHCDISNDGDKLEKILNVWWRKVKKNGLILFEGGSKERDNVEWMKKYKKIPISKFKDSLAFGCYEDGSVEFVTITPYPSITICRKIY